MVRQCGARSAQLSPGGSAHRPLAARSVVLRRSGSVQLIARDLMPTKLRNPHSVCYINASAQAFCWLGFLAADQESCFGQAHSAMRLLMRGGTSYLPSCLPWLPLLRGWANLAVQHDCGEFMTHLLHRAAPRAYVGMWQSRLSDPHTVREAGDLSSPILLDMQSVDQWTHQAAVHALTHHSGLVVLQIKRYGFEHDSPTKTLAPLRVLPGEIIALYHILPHKKAWSCSFCVSAWVM